MSTPVSNQIRKRRAVAEALNRQKVLVCSRRFNGGETVSRVLISDEYYDVSNVTLAALQKGATPKELQLEPAADEA